MKEPHGLAEEALYRAPLQALRAIPAEHSVTGLRGVDIQRPEWRQDLTHAVSEALEHLAEVLDLSSTPQLWVSLRKGGMPRVRVRARVRVRLRA